MNVSNFYITYVCLFHIGSITLDSSTGISNLQVHSSCSSIGLNYAPVVSTITSDTQEQSLSNSISLSNSPVRSSATLSTSINDTLRYNERFLVEIQPLSTREIHVIFTEYHTLKMHMGGTELRISGNNSDAAKGRVRLVIVLLTAVALSAERLTLHLAEPPQLETLSVQLQQRFLIRLKEIEESADISRRGQLLVVLLKRVSMS